MNASSAPPVSTRPLVLVIDDEEMVREAVSDILELAEIETLTATGGAEGLLLYHAYQDRIGLVILDMRMPGMSGPETFEQLVAIDPDVRIVLSSGYNEADMTTFLATRQPVGFLQKPYDLKRLIQTVTEALDSAESDA